MEAIELPPADLVWAGFSLLFCSPDRFGDVWARIRGALLPGGRFAGHLLGDRDTWAPDPSISSFSREQALALFDGLDIEHTEEEEKDGDACSEPKHWHVFHVVARRPGKQPWRARAVDPAAAPQGAGAAPRAAPRP